MESRLEPEGVEGTWTPSSTGLGKLWDHVAGVGGFHLNAVPLTRLHESPVCFFLLQPTPFLDSYFLFPLNLGLKVAWCDHRPALS